MIDLISETVVPTWVMVIVVGGLTVCLFAGVPLARMAGRRRGHRLAHPEQFTTRRDKAKDTALFLAALVPSVLVWLAVMGVSFIGLTGFAADVMKWSHWTNVLVPLSLDGISVSFGAWAFVAVKRGRHPGRAYKIVAGAATMSAVLNFVHGQGEYSVWAGAYLAFLSFAGMAMFHELLDQFMATLDDEVALKTRYPRFGQRWIYAPVSTFVARRTWIVHPAPPDMKPTAANALAWHQQVKASKSARSQQDELLKQHAALTMELELVTLKSKVDETRRALEAAGRVPERRKPSPYPPPDSDGSGNGVPNHGAPNGAPSHGAPTDRPTAHGAPTDGAPRTDPRRTDTDDLDPVMLTHADSIMIIAEKFPDWKTKLPSQRAAINAIDEVRRGRDGSGFNSGSTVSKILKAMERIKESNEPDQVLVKLHAVSKETLDS